MEEDALRPCDTQADSRNATKADYQTEYDLVMQDEHPWTSETNHAKKDDNIGDAENEDLPMDKYRERMRDVLGSDEDDDQVPSANGGNDTANTTNGYHERLQETVSDEVSEQLKTRTDDVSTLTEDVSMVSSASIKPLRPWQFPTPRRLRVLRVEDDQSVTSSSHALGSPSIAPSSDDGLSLRNLSVLPYGDIHSAHSFYSSGTNGKSHSGPSHEHKSFLRLSRLCVLSDKEGNPTVMAVASGVLAIGTRQGKIGLFNRNRGWTGAIAVDGTVSALAISSDKTYIAIGTENGHIYLYDLSKLHSPARHVPPVAPSSIFSGRSEGHLQDSKIIHLAFVGTRRTALVSADNNGLCFYHSLGKILGVSSNDTLRILGRYPDANEQQIVRSTVLAMSTLPLGPHPHPSDSHHFVAILTPSKLVLVGLKPAARTWYRRMSPDRRNSEPSCGTVAWLPAQETREASNEQPQVISPILAFSFGSSLFFLHITTGPSELSMKEEPVFHHAYRIRALKWLTPHHIVLYSDSKVCFYDRHVGKCTEEQAFLQPLQNQWNTAFVERPIAGSLSGSFKVHKGQLFILSPMEILVGTLVTWADRILALVSNGDPLGAVELATEYLANPEIGGSRIGLPKTFEEQRPIISSRLLELMRASTAYTFSEDRMKDDLANHADGVDRTPLFAGLARVCAQACIVLQDFSFLFDELYDAYSDAGIESVFADQMEMFIVQGQMRVLPIPVVQRLVSFRKRQERYDLAEQIIRNVDPLSLDLDQAISLCLEHHLYDALIYVYTKALHDYVGPVVELLPLVKDGDIEAYRLFSYLSISLIGRSYPGQTQLSLEDASEARSALYGFLFSGRCVLWPEESGGKLITTLDGEMDEPIYPYLRLFLQFDGEALLDVIDLAFEDVWLDDNETWSRQRIVSLLYDLDNVPHDVGIFVAIFIARNAPKYPQFIHLKENMVQHLIAVLSSSLLEDEDTKADREFAVECLLSAYKPPYTNRLLADFERSGFINILLRVYRSEGKWDKLAEVMLAHADENIFDGLDQALRRSKKDSRVVHIILQALATLIDLDVEQSVALVKQHVASRIPEAVQILDRSPHRQLSFLSTLLCSEEDPSQLTPELRSLYISLLCSIEPGQVLQALDAHETSYFDLDHVVDVTQEEEVADGLLWALDRQGNTTKCFEKMQTILDECALVLRSSPHTESEHESSWEQEVTHTRDQVTRLVNVATRICVEHSQEDFWVTLLQSLIRLAHDTASVQAALAFSRGLLQDVLSAFVTSSSTDEATFANLFRRLAPDAGSTYGEVRDIADAMMGALRLRQDVLNITNRLFDRDVFVAMQRLTRERRRGWRPSSGSATCMGCGQACVGQIPRAKDQMAEPYSGLTSPAMEIGGSTTIKSPSFLEPSVSPRPDKGKGVDRGPNSNYWSHGAQQLSVPEPTDDFFSMAESMHASDPSDLFSAPVATHQDTSMDSQQIQFSTGDKMSDHSIRMDDHLLICFDGHVWHRRCAPPRLLMESTTCSTVVD